MLQDYLYLYEYSRLFSLGVVKAADHELMRTFSAMTDSTLNGEMKTHKSYMARLGITESDVARATVSLVNSSYTNYMLAVGYNGDVLDILVAVLSCAWSYEQIGWRLAKYPGAARHPFLANGSKVISATIITGLFRKILTLSINMDRILIMAAYRRLEDIFIRCSRYEGQFWDMSWNMEL